MKTETLLRELENMTLLVRMALLFCDDETFKKNATEMADKAQEICNKARAETPDANADDQPITFGR